MIPKDIRLLMFEVAEKLTGYDNLEMLFYPREHAGTSWGYHVIEQHGNPPEIGILVELTQDDALGTLLHEIGHAYDCKDSEPPTMSLGDLISAYGRNAVDIATANINSEREASADRWRDNLLSLVEDHETVRAKLEALLEWNGENV